MNKTILGLALAATLSTSVLAAPLFPDVPDNHWAKDAVAALAAKGLVEGYPDGTFKGDRAASRWEVAMIVARLLAKMEQEHATFATKAELEELRKLVEALREELNALGVRVTNLEENTARIDKRVTELERVTFYGNITVRAGTQSFKNVGSAQSDPTAPLVNYQAAVGTVVGAGDVVPGTGANFDPFAFGVLPVVNWGKGTPLTSGQTFTSDMRLGLKVKVSDDIRGEIEFAAYTAQGDALVDVYYGTPASYLLNPFTALSTVTGGLAGTQPVNHRPFTRMVLDHVWLRHEPSRTELTLGTFLNTDYDPLVYVPMINPGAFGPKYLGSYGAQVRGQVTLDGEVDSDGNETRYTWMDYEVMGTVLPDRNGGVGGAGYFNHAEGANVGFNFHDRRGRARLNFLHAGQDASGGAALQTGLITTVNANSLTPWVNPNGFYAGQVGAPGSAVIAGIGSVTDVRPVPMPAAFDGISLTPGLANVGNVGPQDQTMLGASLKYVFDHEAKPFLGAEVGLSDYRPQKNSGFTTSGEAWRIRAGAELLDGDLNLEAEYLSVDPRYDPFVLQIPRVGGIGLNHWRPFDLNQYGNLYSLHDTELFPHNREGVRFSGDWVFARSDEARGQMTLGRLFLKYANLSQHTTSLQDVRFSPGSLGGGVPNSFVLGFTPGFVEPAFGALSILTFTPDANGNLLGNVLENPRGRMEGLQAGISYKFLFDSAEDKDPSSLGMTPSFQFRRNNFFRSSSLASLRPGFAGIVGENQNFQNYTYQLMHAQLDYDASESVVVRVGYDQYDLFGHWDPYGTYGTYAATTGLTRFTNLDTTMANPFLGLDWQIEENTSVSFEGRYYSTRDHVPASVFPTPSFPATNLLLPAQRSAHPFNWEGFQLTTAFNFRF